MLLQSGRTPDGNGAADPDQFAGLGRAGCIKWMVGGKGKFSEFGAVQKEGLPGSHSGIIVAVTDWNKSPMRGMHGRDPDPGRILSRIDSENRQQRKSSDNASADRVRMVTILMETKQTSTQPTDLTV